MQSDPISDMLTRIRNATLARHKQVLIPSSRTKQAIAKILKDEGFIQSYDVTKDAPQPMLRLILKYDGARKPVLTGSKRISKPGRRVYTSRRNIPLVYSGLGVAILSTPQGIMSGVSARRAGVGGEVLCYVW